MTKKQVALEKYDSQRFGPLLGVSDEGPATATILNASYESAKACANRTPDEMVVGVIFDGERMGSAGEVPIGPDEYDDFLPVAHGPIWHIFCSTNVGTRVNTRLHQPLPEFPVADAAKDEAAWLKSVFDKFAPFLKTPDGKPRPLTVRLEVKSDACQDALAALVPKLEGGRKEGKLGPADLHRLSVLIVYPDLIGTNVKPIQDLITLAAKLGVPEVAVDGDLVEAARRRLSIQGLLNVLDPEPARQLLKAAKQAKVRVTYRFEDDQESAARTVWTGLNSARSVGLSAGKYGLTPLVLDQMRYVVRNVQRWTQGWTAIPAFYVDTPLVTEDDVYETDRVVDAAKLWLDMVREGGGKVVLIDAPDRIKPRKLLKSKGGPDDPGVLTIADVDVVNTYAESLGLRVLWSGGISADQAFDLGKLGVFGFFTTGSTATKVAVEGTLLPDAQFASQARPTRLGVRKIHALGQAGYLCRILKDADLVKKIEQAAVPLKTSAVAGADLESAVNAINVLLQQGWLLHWSD